MSKIKRLDDFSCNKSYDNMSLFDVSFVMKKTNTIYNNLKRGFLGRNYFMQIAMYKIQILSLHSNFHLAIYLLFINLIFKS